MLKIVTGYALLKTLSTPFSPHTFAFSVAVWPLVSAHIILSSIMLKAGGFWLRPEADRLLLPYQAHYYEICHHPLSAFSTQLPDKGASINIVGDTSIVLQI